MSNTIDVAQWRTVTGAQQSPLNLRLIGRTLPNVAKPYSVWAGLISDSVVPSDHNYFREVHEDQFDIGFQLPDGVQNARIHFTNSVQVSLYQIAFNLERAYLIEGPASSHVYSDAVSRSEYPGLRRRFTVDPTKIANYEPSPSGGYVVEVPMVFSRYLVARQGDLVLKSWVDFNYRLNVRVRDLVQPIWVTYEIPRLIWWLTISGIAALALVLLLPIGLLLGRRN